MLAIALFAGAFGPTGVQAQEENATQRSVTAHGFAIVEAEPDMATMEFQVVGEGDDTDEATDEAEEFTDEVVAELEEQGIDSDAIETSQVDERDRATDAERVTMQITARTDEVDDVETIAEAVADATGAELMNVSYELEDAGQTRQAAREAALDDARQSAESLAKLADGSLGEIISINQISTPALGPQSVFGQGGDGLLGLGMLDTSQFEGLLENLLSLIFSMMFGMDGANNGNIQLDDIFGSQDGQDFIEDGFTQSVPVTLEVTWAIE
ncbi:MAG: SIMPL domain-containing protein [Thermomicrobiales bacterium]